MKRAILALVGILFIVTIVPHVARGGTEPSPVPWLLSFFGHHAIPAPPCRAPKECTAEERAARDEVAEVRLSIARSATSVAFDTTEAPLFTGAHGRARTALRLAAIGAHETGLQPRLVKGTCKPGECDGGKAVGVGQVHPGDYGLRLLHNGKIFQCTKSDHDGCLTREDLLADPIAMQRVMLHILRTGGLSLYTGEGNAVEGDASLTIREWEARWFKAHPPPAKDDDVLEAIAEDVGAP